MTTKLDKALLRLRANDATLTELDLNCQNIHDEGAIAFATALKENTTLKELYLWNNWIGDEGAKALADALKTNNTLKELYLSGNDIGDDGAKAFLNALTDRRSSAFLHLKNNLGGWSATVLADDLNYNNTLTCLYLQENNIGDELERQTRELLKRNGGNYYDSSEDDSSEGDY